MEQFFPGGVLLGIFGGGVPPASPNPDPISDQKMPFPIPVSRPGLKNPYPFSDLILYMIKHSIIASVLNGIQRNKDEYVKFSWNDLFYLFLFSLTSYSPQLLGRKKVPQITIPNFRPKCSISTPIFRPKRLKNHTLWGGTYLYT